MEKSNELFDIPKCPACGKAHQYSLAVMRSSYLFSAEGTAPAEKRVRRLFTCPKTGTDFEGVVVVQDDPKNKIVSITVASLIEEAK